VHTVVSSSNIAAIGFCLLILAILFRSNIQGYDWLEKFNLYPALKQLWITEIKPDLIRVISPRTKNSLISYGLPNNTQEGFLGQEEE
jgi:hypothetical protein